MLGPELLKCHRQCIIAIMTEETVLAIDYGTVRVGLAKSVLSFAQPLKIIGNTPKLIPELVALCQELSITRIVVGLSENTMAEKTREFVTELQKNIELPIDFWDETLSSQAVHQKVRELGRNKGKNRQAIDHYAAAEILQDWLDSQ